MWGDERRLRRAAEAGDQATLEKLLKRKAAVDCSDRNGMTPLMNAAWKGHEEAVQLLLQHGADARRSQKDGTTAFWYAAIRGHSGIMQQLVRAGADVNSRGDGDTALAFLTVLGRIDAVSALLAVGADPRKGDKHNRTPLEIAIEFKEEELARLLTAAVADAEERERGRPGNERSRGFGDAIERYCKVKDAVRGFEASLLMRKMICVILTKKTPAEIHELCDRMVVAHKNGESDMKGFISRLEATELGIDGQLPGDKANDQPASTASAPIVEAEHCGRCSKAVLRQDQFLEACRQAGLVVGEDGRVSLRIGGLAGTHESVERSIEDQRARQQKLHDSLESQKGFRCTGCRQAYCTDCLFNHAPSRAGGGKACPTCGGSFAYLT